MTTPLSKYVKVDFTHYLHNNNTIKMKNLIYILAFALTIISCNNDDDNLTPLEQLPKATQTGEGTFGCLVNGMPFIETGTFFNCFYQFVNGEYFFHISAESEALNINEITIYSNKVELSSGETYQLGNNEERSISGITFFSDAIQNVSTKNSIPGTLQITKLDIQNNIISGTFNFKVNHPITNEEINVTDGRFDTKFTQ